jgi:hypothetical protein
MTRRATDGNGKTRKRASRVPVTIRLPENIVEQVDQEREKRAVPVSRNNWLFEAVLEKLRSAGGPHGTQ